MKSQRRRRIQIQIHVVHDVEAPQPGHLVHEHVPDVKRVIEQEDGERHTERLR